MIINNVNKSSYSHYTRKENKQSPSFGFRFGSRVLYRLGLNPERTKNGAIHEIANLGIAAAVSHVTDLPLFQSFAIVKIAKDISTATISHLRFPANFKAKMTDLRRDYPSNILRPAMAVIDNVGDKLKTEEGRQVTKKVIGWESLNLALGAAFTQISHAPFFELYLASKALTGSMLTCLAYLRADDAKFMSKFVKNITPVDLMDEFKLMTKAVSEIDPSGLFHPILKAIDYAGDGRIIKRLRNFRKPSSSLKDQNKITYKYL